MVFMVTMVSVGNNSVSMATLRILWLLWSSYSFKDVLLTVATIGILWVQWSSWQPWRHLGCYLQHGSHKVTSGTVAILEALKFPRNQYGYTLVVMVTMSSLEIHTLVSIVTNRIF